MMLHMQGSIMYTTNNKFKSPVFIPNSPVLKGRTVSLKNFFVFQLNSMNIGEVLVGTYR